MNFRLDIQALRGFAVLLVIINHAKLGLAGGYLGVDIFFVISGYLITGVIKRGIDSGDFSFSEFYYRRAKRLLPAAYTVFIFTSILSVVFLSHSELSDFAKQLIGSLTFTSNIVLWQQSDYFSSSSTLKPLLHIWSLSIEEQYYLILPAVLFYLPRRVWVLSMVLIILVSLALCLVLVPLKPVASFYLLPTRAWELGIGSLAALIVVNKKHFVLQYLFWPSIIAIAVIPIMPIGHAHPGIDAILVCISTIIIIVRNHDSLYYSFPIRTLSKVGDFSYSLYLVHWPLFAFINNVYIDEPSTSVYTFCLVISLLIGFLLYKFVELPIRLKNIQVTTRVLLGFVVLTSVMIAFSFSIISQSLANADASQTWVEGYGFGVECNYSSNFIPKKQCQSSEKPSILIWGDSFAMHLVPGIDATTDAGVIQATRTVCGPFIDVAPIYAPTYSRAWAEKCLAFNQSVLDYLSETPSVEIVVMSSPFRQFLGEAENNQSWRSLVNLNGKLVERKSNTTNAIEEMQVTIKKLRLLGKKVIIVAPPPVSGFNIARCLERKADGLVSLGEHGDCITSLDEYKKNKAKVIDFLNKVESQLDVEVVFFDDVLCSKISCATTLDGKVLYSDSEHFTNEGSIEVAKKMQLGYLIQNSAK